MPEVFATGFMVGLVEWACIEAIAPHLEEGELSLGTHVDLSHDAATPPGMEVVARVRLEEVDGRKLTFSAVAEDARDRICEGTHRRFVIDRARFDAGVARKAGLESGDGVAKIPGNALGFPIRALRLLVRPALLLAAVAVAAVALAPAPASAAPAPFSLRFTANAPGDVTIAGNTVMTCPP